MRSRTLGAIGAVLVMLALGACGDDDTDPAADAADEPATGAEPADAGDSTADAATGTNELLSFDGELVSGGTFSGADLAGRDAVLWFWAPWCTVCRAEAPDVVEVAAAFGDDVPIIGVASRGPLEDMEAFVAETGTGGFEHLADVDGSIWQSFGVVSQPSFAFIDDSGEIEVVTASFDADELTARLDALAAA